MPGTAGHSYIRKRARYVRLLKDVQARAVNDSWLENGSSHFEKEK